MNSVLEEYNQVKLIIRLRYTDVFIFCNKGRDKSEKFEKKKGKCKDLRDSQKHLSLVRLLMCGLLKSLVVRYRKSK